MKFNGFFAAISPNPELPFAPSDVLPPSKAIPSTTYNGPPPLNEVVPRIRISIAEPGSPLLGVNCTPATRPCNNCSGEEITPWLKSFADNEETPPVASFLVVVP